MNKLESNNTKALLVDDHLSVFLNSDLVFGNSDPAVVEVLPFGHAIVEDLKYMHLVKNSLGAAHGKTTALELGDELQSELPEGLLVFVDSNVFGMIDFLLGDSDPVVVEGGPVSSVVVENLVDMHQMENSLGALHGDTAVLELGEVLDSKRPKALLVSLDSNVFSASNPLLGDSNPLDLEVSPMTRPVFENMMDFNQMHDSHSASHGDTTAAHLILIISSELPEMSLFFLDSEVFSLFDLDGGYSDPVTVEVRP
jgi:hypothetical protein